MMLWRGGDRGGVRVAFATRSANLSFRPSLMVTEWLYQHLELRSDDDEDNDYKLLQLLHHFRHRTSSHEERDATLSILRLGQTRFLPLFLQGPLHTV